MHHHLAVLSKSVSIHRVFLWTDAVRSSGQHVQILLMVCQTKRPLETL